MIPEELSFLVLLGERLRNDSSGAQILSLNERAVGKCFKVLK